MTMNQLKIQLHNTKPTQSDLDQAKAVLRWLSDHAHAWPGEYYEGAAKDLACAADMCVQAQNLLTNDQEIAGRDEENTQILSGTKSL